MSELERLIQELCPNGVTYKKAAEIAEITIGEFVHKNKQNPDGKYPVFNLVTDLQSRAIGRILH